LHAIGFRLYAFAHSGDNECPERDRELLDIQQLVQDEAANVRTLIQQLKPLDFDPRHLVDFLAGMIERYRSIQALPPSLSVIFAMWPFPTYLSRGRRHRPGSAGECGQA